MEESPKPNRSRRNLFRFSLFALLILISCTAGYLSGYRWGGQTKDQYVYDNAITVVTYKVADLVTPIAPDGVKLPASTADYDSLIDLIVTTVESDSWMENGKGGMNEIQPFPTNLSLVVTANGRVHAQLRDLLDKLRDTQYKLDDEYAVSIREAIARKRQEPTIIRWVPTVNSELHGGMKNQFESVVRELTSSHGKPKVSKAGDTGFPAWATAQRIAVWDLKGGKLYFALQDTTYGGEVLVAGWWEEAFGPVKPAKLHSGAIVTAE